MSPRVSGSLGRNVRQQHRTDVSSRPGHGSLTGSCSSGPASHTHTGHNSPGAVPSLTHARFRVGTRAVGRWRHCSPSRLPETLRAAALRYVHLARTQTTQAARHAGRMPRRTHVTQDTRRHTGHTSHRTHVTQDTRHTGRTSRRTHVTQDAHHAGHTSHRTHVTQDARHAGHTSHRTHVTQDTRHTGHTLHRTHVTQDTRHTGRTSRRTHVTQDTRRHTGRTSHRTHVTQDTRSVKQTLLCPPRRPARGRTKARMSLCAPC